MKIRLFILCWLMVGTVLIPAANAGVADFADFFEVDLEKDELPSVSELETNFAKYDNYNKKYKSFYDLLGDFDSEFYTAIASYGGREKVLQLWLFDL